MNIQQAVKDGFSIPHGRACKIGDTVQARRARPFMASENIFADIVGWDKWGPRFSPLSDIMPITLNSGDDVRMANME